MKVAGKVAGLLVGLLATLAVTGCPASIPSSLLGVERRDGQYLLVVFQCASEQIERIGIGSGVDMESGYQAELEPERLEKSDRLFEFELAGLAPPRTQRLSDPEFPLHIWVQFDDGASQTFARRAPRESHILYHERGEEGLFVEVEASRSAFLEQATVRCENLHG